jgi:hypothetical protein
MTRLGFGVNIAPKVLRTVIKNILPEQLYNEIGIYIDDIYIPTSKVEEMKTHLNKNGFQIKDPEPLIKARILGLQNYPDGYWTRRQEEIPKVLIHTRRGIHSWTGKLIAHYPVANWLRPATAIMNRLTSPPDQTKKEWDAVLTNDQIKMCEHLQQDIQERSDPVTAKWYYNVSDPWTLYTDASSIAFGAVLLIGDVYVEDSTWLRKKCDRQPINVAELKAVYKALTLPILYIDAMQIAHTQIINLKTDNNNVHGWLSRSEERQWKKIKAINSKVIEKLLMNIADLCKTYNIKLNIELVKSEDNISDALTRIPEYIKYETDIFEPNEIKDIIMVQELPAPQQTDEFGRAVVNEQQLTEILRIIHHHEGVESLYHSLIQMVSYPRLRNFCQKYIKNCPKCQMGKVTKHTPIMSQKNIEPEYETPFAKLYMDILGPFNEIEGFQNMFIITCIDHYSRYLCAKTTFSAPTSYDAVQLFRTIVEIFHVVPDVVQCDNGPQFRSGQFFDILTENNCNRVLTPVNASWTNGRIERAHRYINDRLRSELDEEIATDFIRFSNAIKNIIRQYNTAFSYTTKTSPHEMIFTYTPFIHPELKQFRRSLTTNPNDSTKPDHPISDASKTPEVGEIWLHRRRNARKIQTRYMPCKIIEKTSNSFYKVMMKNHSVTREHRRFLKPLTIEAYNSLPHQFKIPEERPLRNLRGGGGV